ncbi:MAG TPA: hypothetical protein VFU15_06425 [Bacteroidia bacterium]|nr:hypothetical protein [Bacteroidia bacterium]
MKNEEENEGQEHPDFAGMFRRLNDHVETRLEYMRLLISEKIAIAFAKAMSGAIQAGIFLLFFFFLNVAAACWIGKHYGDYAIGFGVVSGFYFLCWLIYMALRKSVFEKKMQDSFVKALFTEQDEEDDDENE